MNCLRCDEIGTRPGTCDLCHKAGRHEFAERLPSQAVSMRVLLFLFAAVLVLTWAMKGQRIQATATA